MRPCGLRRSSPTAWKKILAASSTGNSPRKVTASPEKSMMASFPSPRQRRIVRGTSVALIFHDSGIWASDDVALDLYLPSVSVLFVEDASNGTSRIRAHLAGEGFQPAQVARWTLLQCAVFRAEIVRRRPVASSMSPTLCCLCNKCLVDGHSVTLAISSINSLLAKEMRRPSSCAAR